MATASAMPVQIDVQDLPGVLRGRVPALCRFYLFTARLAQTLAPRVILDAPLLQLGLRSTGQAHRFDQAFTRNLVRGDRVSEILVALLFSFLRTYKASLRLLLGGLFARALRLGDGGQLLCLDSGCSGLLQLLAQIGSFTLQARHRFQP